MTTQIKITFLDIMIDELNSNITHWSGLCTLAHDTIGHSWQNSFPELGEHINNSVKKCNEKNGQLSPFLRPFKISVDTFMDVDDVIKHQELRVKVLKELRINLAKKL